VGVIYVHADTSGLDSFCSTWLCLNPAQALATAGYAVQIMSVTDFVAKRPLDELIVVERLLWDGCEPSTFDSMPNGPVKSLLLEFAGLRVLETIEYAQSKGCKVIAVFDDHYEQYPEHAEFNGIRDKWLHGTISGRAMGFLPADDFKRGLGLVDAAMTPSRYLCDYYGRYARKMYYVHNRPTFSSAPWWSVVNTAPRPDGKLVLGWSGTAQHYHTWLDNKHLLGALVVLRDEIVLRGVIPPAIARIIDSYGIELEVLPPVPMDRFPDVVATYDVGICPLQGEYDQGRSWIKWLECSLMGKPVVASRLAGVYDECRGGYRVKDESVKEWVTALEWLTNADMRQVKAAEGLSWAWGQGWDENLAELLRVFVEVLHD